MNIKNIKKGKDWKSITRDPFVSKDIKQKMYEKEISGKEKVLYKSPNYSIIKYNKTYFILDENGNFVTKRNTWQDAKYYVQTFDE